MSWQAGSPISHASLSSTRRCFIYHLRPATQQDFPAIRSLILQVQINPLNLDWRRFLVAVDEQGVLIGCGQIKRHADGSAELASIAVVAKQRGRGIAREIINHLIAGHPTGEPLYLTCRASLRLLYEKFGFCMIESGEMPPYFRRVRRIFFWLLRLKLAHEELLVMERKN
jgi:N-acetylglutamate synthase-like GNAT family acetyltransferase